MSSIKKTSTDLYRSLKLAALPLEIDPIKSFVNSKPRLLGKEFREFQLVNFEQRGKVAQIMDTNNFETYFIDSTDVAGFSEGMVFEGILFNGTLLLRQKKK